MEKRAGYGEEDAAVVKLSQLAIEDTKAYHLTILRSLHACSPQRCLSVSDAGISPATCVQVGVQNGLGRGT